MEPERAFLQSLSSTASLWKYSRDLRSVGGSVDGHNCNRNFRADIYRGWLYHCIIMISEKEVSEGKTERAFLWEKEKEFRPPQ